MQPKNEFSEPLKTEQVFVWEGSVLGEREAVMVSIRLQVMMQALEVGRSLFGANRFEGGGSHSFFAAVRLQSPASAHQKLC